MAEDRKEGVYEVFVSQTGKDEKRGGTAPKPKRRAGRPRDKAAVQETQRIRLGFDVSPSFMETIDRVREKSGSTTNNELVRRAVALFERHLDETAAGSRGVYERPDGTRVEIVLV